MSADFPIDAAPAEPVPSMGGDSPEEIAKDVVSVGRIEAVPTLLDILCATTGMRFAAVARVTEHTWTACAIRDEIEFGLKPGGQLDVKSTLCYETRDERKPIVIDHASKDPRYCGHHTPQIYKIESYVSVPIILGDGRHFGNLCAIDPAPASVSDPKTLALFEGFAKVIALSLDADLAREKDLRVLKDTQTTSELREQFIAVLGHDLRNPLQAIHATGELLERKIPDPALAKMAGRIRTNANRMSALIDDVLDFARGRLGGGIAVEKHLAYNMDESLHAVVRELQDARPDRQITVAMDISAPIRCDQRRIQQVVSNLISNALTHGSPHTPVLFTAKTEAEHVILEVWNTGEPIPVESITKIFDPFWRQGTAPSRQGLGLGLHICAQIVQSHGGQLAVTSTRESGTCFRVSLPLQQRLG